ncbi:MAG TPA: hypothetical protein VN914_17530 [Polyangia bacterium]|nr:hypothetical protein [Polyangia bacterium]
MLLPRGPLGAFVCLAALAGCRARAPLPRDAVAPDVRRPDDVAPAPRAAAEPPLNLRWSPDGRWILVDQRWVLWPESGETKPFACGPEGAEIDCRVPVVAIAPDSKRVLVVDGDHFAVGPPNGPLGPAVRIPSWLSGGVDPSTFGFWLDARRVLVQQYERHGDTPAQCRIYELDRRRWQRAAACVRPDLENVWRIDGGPDGWIAIHAGGEGVQSVLLARYDPATGQRDAPLGVDPEPPGAAFASFGKTGSVDLVSPCRLGQKHGPCPEAPEAPWNLYSASLTDGTLTLRRSDLPAGAVPDPRGGRFAWPAGRAVCLGEPSQPPTITCHPL